MTNIYIQIHEVSMLRSVHKTSDVWCCDVWHKDLLLLVLLDLAHDLELSPSLGKVHTVLVVIEHVAVANVNERQVLQVETAVQSREHITGRLSARRSTKHLFSC